MDRSSKAFIELLEPNYTHAIQNCKALTRDQTQAKDLLQDSLLSALQNFYALKDEERFKPWLFKIISRNFLAAKNKKLRFDAYSKSIKAEGLTFPDVLQNESNDPKVELLIKALDAISDKERIALVLFEIGGFSLDEIMHIQKEKTLSAIKSRLSRAREKLKLRIEYLEERTSNKKEG